MAAVRSGAWSRRAILRAVGWWEPAADELISRDLGWRRDGRTLSVGAAGASAGTSSNGFVLRLASLKQLDTLVANLITLAALTNRTPVVPHFSCALVAQWRVRQVVTASSGPEGEPLCAWVPPTECEKLEYLLPTELGKLPRGQPPHRGEMASGRHRRAACSSRGPGDGARNHTGGAPERMHRLARRLLCEEAPHESLLGGHGRSAVSHNEAGHTLRWLKHWALGPSLLGGGVRLPSVWQAATAETSRRDNETARCWRKLVAGAVIGASDTLFRRMRMANSSKPARGSTSSPLQRT
jgi:hypothetical protein